MLHFSVLKNGYHIKKITHSISTKYVNIAEVTYKEDRIKYLDIITKN